jgi:hypothetical protein
MTAGDHQGKENYLTYAAYKLFQNPASRFTGDFKDQFKAGSSNVPDFADLPVLNPVTPGFRYLGGRFGHIDFPILVM